jgi:Ca2+ transporting ATPase
LDESDDRGVVNIEKGGLILFSLIGIRDVLHMAVPQAVRQCQKAKIKVKMITADNKITARAVAKECNIVSNEEKNTIMEGPEFMNRIGGVVCKNCRKNICDCAPNERLAAFTNKPLRKDSILNAQEFNNIYENIDVLARSRPEDKYAYVVGLKERGHVVAVTGDDVISLKAADVGISMGISGTDLAKEASGIILLDDNFSSIVQAVIWARNTHHSIRKSLQFQLTLMIVAVGTSLIGALALRQNIFTPIQMLWV